VATLQVASLREQLALTRKTFSRLTGFSERAVSGWEHGKPINESGLRRIREIERLQRKLASLVNAEVIPEWLETPNPEFDNLKPLEVIERGEVDRIWNMIFYLESGTAG
jgi:transcriptional regulator with XRE-family HTH domain